jgi:hypothetical protein
MGGLTVGGDLPTLLRTAADHMCAIRGFTVDTEPFS